MAYEKLLVFDVITAHADRTWTATLKARIMYVVGDLVEISSLEDV
jgi:hypothetical protein